VSGLISYEYEGYRLIPVIAIAVLILAGLRRVLLPPAGLRELSSRTRSLIEIAWRPALAFVIAAGVAISPMIVGIRGGDDLYFRRVAAHAEDSANAPAGSPDDWQSRLSWGLERFLPYDLDSSGDYDPYFGAVDGRPLVDWVAGTLLIIALLAGVIGFARPFRLFFVIWIVGTIVGGSLLVTGALNSGRLIGALIAGFALVGLLIHDAGDLLRVGSRPLLRTGFVLVLSAAALYVAFWNVTTFDAIAKNPDNSATLYEGRGEIYPLCMYLQERGNDNFTHAFNGSVPGLGFDKPRITDEQRSAAWGEYAWACRELEGTGLAAPEEAWPLPAVQLGKTTLVFLNPPTEADEIDTLLRRAYPVLPSPRIDVGPGAHHSLMSYELDSLEALQRRGLWGRYFRDDSPSPVLQRIDPMPSIRWERDGMPLAPPFTVRWQGLIRVRDAEPVALRAKTDDPVRTMIDGKLASDGTSLLVEPGWHVIEIEVQKRSPSGEVLLEWIDGSGRATPVEPQDLFPLESLDGWLHTRIFTTHDGSTLTEQRLDFSVHYAATEAAASQVDLTQGAAPPRLARERWEGVWQIEDDTALLARLRSVGSRAVLSIDGREALRVEPTGLDAEVTAEREIRLAPGPHRVVIEEEHMNGPWSGARLETFRSVSQPSGQPPVLVDKDIRVTPY
jgi:hypothetical protein